MLLQEIQAACVQILLDIPAGDLFNTMYGAPLWRLQQMHEFYLHHECYAHCHALKQLIDLSEVELPPF